MNTWPLLLLRTTSLHVYLGHTKTTGGCKQVTKNEQCAQLRPIDQRKQIYEKVMTSCKEQLGAKLKTLGEKKTGKELVS